MSNRIDPSVAIVGAIKNYSYKPFLVAPPSGYHSIFVWGVFDGASARLMLGPNEAHQAIAYATYTAETALTGIAIGAGAWLKWEVINAGANTNLNMKFA